MQKRKYALIIRTVTRPVGRELVWFTFCTKRNVTLFYSDLKYLEFEFKDLEKREA